jgi:hypothetical protein
MRKIVFTYGLLFLFVYNVYGQIEGVVIDKKKFVIPNAIIIAMDSTGRAIDTVRSGERGGYAFKGLKPGKYNVEAMATGYLHTIYKNIEVSNPSEEADEGDDTYYAIRLDIVLNPGKIP